MVAGGSGRRFGARKQFLPLAGLPVAAWSVRGARTVSAGEKRMLQRARQILVSELTFALNVDEETAEERLNEALT